LDRALSDEGHTVIILSAALPDTVPVNRHLHTFHMILDIDHDTIVLADLNARPWDHTVRGQDATFDAIGENALAVTPYGVGCVWRAHLTSSVKGKESQIKAPVILIVF
jgi:hypothetical protein